MRTINEIIVHCTGTRAGKQLTAAQIRHYHMKHRGWRDIGYHYVVLLDGSTQTGRPLEQAGAHCTGHNAHSIGVCYVGGLDDNGRAADTRTAAQKAALRTLVAQLLSQFPGASVHGHRDFARKDCPCFDAVTEYADLSHKKTTRYD